jgi:hypothetical protein
MIFEPPNSTESQSGTNDRADRQLQLTKLVLPIFEPPTIHDRAGRQLLQLTKLVLPILEPPIARYWYSHQLANEHRNLNVKIFVDVVRNDEHIIHTQT